MNPHQVTRDFEAALTEYTGARFAVTTTSCTMALLLALKWENVDGGGVLIPSRTYVSVPQSVINAGAYPLFRNIEWQGAYRLENTAVWDSARRFTSGMYVPGQFQCCSFGPRKILSDTQGGCVLHDDEEADDFLRRMRYDGRREGVPIGEDDILPGAYHAYLSPDVSARLLWKLSVLPMHNDDLLNDNYPDLSKMEAFK